MPDLAVLPYTSPTGSAPWLLKIHGGVSRPEDMVLTREQYVEHQDVRGSLAGVVQALLMTRHTLDVGYSLADDTVIRLAAQVQRLTPDTQVRGTVVGLLPDPLREELWRGALTSLAWTWPLTAIRSRSPPGGSRSGPTSWHTTPASSTSSSSTPPTKTSSTSTSMRSSTSYAPSPPASTASTAPFAARLKAVFEALGARVE